MRTQEHLDPSLTLSPRGPLPLLLLGMHRGRPSLQPGQAHSSMLRLWATLSLLLLPAVAPQVSPSG